MLKTHMEQNINFSSTGLKHFNCSKAIIVYSIDMENVYKNIEENNPNKNRKIIFVFDDC